VCALAVIAWSAGVFVSACAHREPDSDVPGPRPPTEPYERARLPTGDVAAALEPCPPNFQPASVRDVLSQKWPNKTCFAVVGHLTATYREGGECEARPVSNDSTGRVSSPPEVPRCVGGWALTDLTDPIVVRSDGVPTQPFMLVTGAGVTPNMVRPLLECNRDAGGNRIMPKSTRFELPFAFDLTDIPRFNVGLANVKVGVLGGQIGRHQMPDVQVTFGYLRITHACRIDTPDGGAQAGG
jgi:hypothetical protein